jgi:hypothetical protein
MLYWSIIVLGKFSIICIYPNLLPNLFFNILCKIILRWLLLLLLLSYLNLLFFMHLGIFNSGLVKEYYVSNCYRWII